MIAFADAGITTFDCADIYTGVEAMIGDFRAEYERVRGAEALSKIKVHTKFVPDLGNLATLSQGRCRKGDRNLAQAPRTWSSSIWFSFTGGIMNRPSGRGGGLAAELRARRQNRQYRRHQFRYHTDAADA
jgi:hypothetical protein